MLVFLAIIVVTLAAAVAALMLRGPFYPPVSTAPPDENATEPYHKEVECIDRVLQNRALKAEDVQPALDRCRDASWGGNQSREQ